MKGMILAYIEPRSAWGAKRQDGDRNLTGLAKEVFLHHTVTAQLPQDATVEQERAQMRSLEQIGQSRFGTGISYNVLVFPSGRAYQGVSFNRRGTHTDKRNSTTRSISFVGQYTANEPTQAQLDTARAIIAEGRGKWWVRNAPVRGHRDIKATNCPGDNVYDKRAWLASAPAKPAPTPTPTTKPKLTVDGVWGPATTRELQRYLGTPVDGVLSRQFKSSANSGILSAQFVRVNRSGSTAVREIQRRLQRRGLYNGKIDGLIGPGTITGLQRFLGTPVDGVISIPSTAVRAIQTQINESRFAL